MSIADELKKSHIDILDVVQELTEDELSRQNTIGKWSARDVLLHIAMWEGEAVKALTVWRTGHQPDWNYLNDKKIILKFNDFWIENLKHLSATQVLKMLNLTHSSLVADVSAIPEEIWDKRGGTPKWLSEITFEHNKEHLPGLIAYKNSLGK